MGFVSRDRMIDQDLDGTTLKILNAILLSNNAKHRHIAVFAFPWAEKPDYLLSGHSKLAITRTCAWSSNSERSCTLQCL